jgi:hypothetical protein
MSGGIPDQNLMTITAASLKEKNPELGFLKSEVRRHIKEIEMHIREAVRDKQTQIKYPIEQNFAVQKISNRTAQRYVYSAIYDQLKTNGFESRLIIKSKEVYFEITWISEMDRDEIARQEMLIEEARSRQL